MAVNWVDRVPTHRGRMKITYEDGTSVYATLERADEASVEGTPVNAANLNSLMSKDGGEFTDDVVAAAVATESSAVIRNIVVVANGAVDSLGSVPVGTIVMEKKVGDS